MKIKCRHLHTLVCKESGFTIAIFRADSEILFPDGNKSEKFTAKGYMLPSNTNQKCELEGSFEKYKKRDGIITYTLKVTGFQEIQPSEEDTIIGYLLTLPGVGKAMAVRIYDKFQNKVFNVLENEPASLELVKGISTNKAIKIAMAHEEKKNMRELYQYMYPYHVKDNCLIKLQQTLGPDAVTQIKNNPYCVTEIAGIGFQTAEQIAREEGIPKDDPARIEAAILEVLLQGEIGGTIFQERVPFPAFIYDRYLQQPLFDLLYDTEHLYVTGNTYLPRNVVYLMTLKLVTLPFSEQDFDKALLRLHLEKKLFLYIDDNDSDKNKIKVYRYKTAQAEFHTAKVLIDLLHAEISPCMGLEKRIQMVEKLLCIKLSDEQKHAVLMGLENPISVITGGPGTGKTSILQSILNVYMRLYPNDNILLAAPTGRAAKRMSDSTGYPAHTLHRALSLNTDNDENLVNLNEKNDMLNYSLIIVDESSMIGSYIFNYLVSRIAPGTRLILVGDVDQLPSIEVGAVLREVIQSGIIPVTMLTKTFRQAGGSSIAVNAARVKTGVSTLEFKNDFVFIEEEKSKEIAERIAELYTELVKKIGFDDIICLSAYRRSTDSGSNALNQLLRERIRNDIQANTPYIERGNTKIYTGDRVMYTRNTKELTNGDVGVLDNIHRTSEHIEIDCTFNGKTVTLVDAESNYIELAYATTIHKSQGSEYKVVIMTSDIAHKNMLKRNLIYTGISRAKEKILIVGQMNSFHLAINTQDSFYRRSALASLLSHFNRKWIEAEKKNIKHEQIKIKL